MDEDEDDLYAPPEAVNAEPTNNALETEVDDDEPMDEDEEEDDDDDDDDDSDIEIVTEAKEPVKLEPSSGSRKVEIKPDKSTSSKNETPSTSSKPQQSANAEQDVATTVTGKPAAPLKPGSEYPAIHSSTIDVDSVPILEATGKSLLKTDMDADFGEDDKPWRRPGIDQTDFFNYGFDEFTWSSYCLKQDTLRSEAKEQKKQVEDMQKLFGMPGGGSNATQGSANAMPGPDAFPPEMMGMMQQMMASGMDPTQMDFNQFMQMSGQGGSGPGGGFTPSGPSGGSGGGGAGGYGGYGGGQGGGGGVGGQGGGGGGGGGGGRHGRRRW